MKNLLYALGPTFMIFIGLTYFESVPITFVLFYSWLFAIPFATYLRKTQDRLDFIQSVKNGFTIKSFLFGLVSGVICLITIFSYVYFSQDYLFNLNQLNELLVKWHFSGSHIWIFIFVLIVINPFLEEWYWREFMHKRLLISLSGIQTVFVTSFFYSLYHLLSLVPMFAMPFSLVATMPIFLAGLLWGYFRIKFRSMVAPIISHTLADIGIILVYLFYFIL
ncbi:CPBP family intramembrane glutamic endopeptidase [Paenisporosarcina sp. TG-14]|uniref:CPBP family intramembrane glutamic endopeptidase n=1 Tax=Paenisporosarcina sp. TG-14 TaxID=1231057 RepID=UPI000305B867|nr:type II CAAX endopeptidase family protein [Paenisporosarcina sp. TG-14]